MLDDDDDLEDLLLERSDTFWAMIARARQGRAISLEAFRRSCSRRDGTPSAPARRRRKPRAAAVPGGAR